MPVATNIHVPAWAIEPERCQFRRRAAIAASAALLAVLATSGISSISTAQAPLYLFDAETKVASIRFDFPESRSFDDKTLLGQIATQQPGFWSKVTFWKNRVFPFDPVTLQKDVVRLRRFYQRNGFLYPSINYLTSKLDTASNRIDVVLTVDEGPPLLIQDVGYYTSDGRYAVSQFDEKLQPKWNEFRGQISIRLGDRFTEFERASIQSKVLNWLNDNGYAFADVQARSTVDSTYNTVDVQFVVIPGPPTTVDRVDVEGNASVKPNVVRREVPIEPGDVFSKSRMVRGQQEIFGLNLFRVVLSDIPDQPHDSTVTIRYRVRESKPRLVTGQLGYSVVEGLGGEGGWRNNNFLGGARNLALGFESDTGLLSRTAGDNESSWKLRANISLHQPYLVSRSLSGVVAPFVLFERDSHLQPSDRFYGLNRREVGLETSLIYQIVRFRTITITYKLNRNLEFTRPIEPDPALVRDPYTKSVFSASGNFGRTDNFLRPTKGFEVRPSIEYASKQIGSEIEFLKLAGDAGIYVPVTHKLSLVGRFSAGRVFPLRRSRDALEGRLGSLDSLKFENRFDPILFEIGGASDVRGWPDRFLGAKIARPVLDNNGALRGFAYEPAGGRSKWTVSAAIVYPFPGLGTAWRMASFVDFGQLSATVRREPDGASIVTDDGRFRSSKIRFGIGSGIRYQTAFGFVRFDVGFKINPSADDLRTASEAYAGDDVQRFMQRFRIHLSLGQTF